MLRAGPRRDDQQTPKGGVHPFHDDPVADRAGQSSGRPLCRAGGDVATSDCWRPAFYLFEAHGLQPWLVNARGVTHLPGRLKTDACHDAVVRRRRIGRR